MDLTHCCQLRRVFLKETLRSSLAVHLMPTRFTDPTEFLRELEKWGPATVYQPRRTYTAFDLTGMIRVERRSTREQGMEWTNWRKFHCVEEAVSPNRCMFWRPNYRRDPHCTIVATYVSYHTRKAERLCLCTGHFREEERRYHESLAAARHDTS